MSGCYRLNFGWPGFLFLTIWLGGNAAIFCTTFLNFKGKEKFTYLFNILHYPICFSKGSAEALNLNCALILLPVCKNIISFLRGICGHKWCGPNVVRRQLDYNIFFHKLVGYAIAFWTAVHYIGHTFNLEGFIHANNSKEPLLLRLSKLPHNESDSWINPITSNETFSVREVMVIIPGWSGVIATLILIIMVASSTEALRRNFYEVFWYTHHLFILFFVFIIVHGLGGVVRSQSNTFEHNPTICSKSPQIWGKSGDCPMPKFSSQSPHTWMWVTGPLILYAIECLIKLINRFRKVEIVEALIHPFDVLELKMKKGGFRSSAGQYITIMCPSLSYLQWHPFTLTSAPEDDYFSIHIKAYGDWTKNLYIKFKQIIEDSKPNGNILYPRISVDGPFGTCCEDVFQYKVVMLIGGGIGVTPYISVLKHIWHLHKKGDKIGIKKVYFYWICRDATFKWFNQMLRQLEEEIETDTDAFISIKIFWSRGWNSEIRKRIMQNECSQEDAVTDLKSKTNFGRPNWNALFGEVRKADSEYDVGVFCCGTKSLSRCIKVQCVNHSNVLPLAKPRFAFHKEKF